MRLGKGVQVIHTHIPTATIHLPISYPTVEAVVRPFEPLLTPNAIQLHKLLHRLALDHLVSKEMPSGVAQVVIHTSGELLAAHLGFSEVTLYKHLKTLNQLGLIHSKGHTSDFYGLARKDGTLIAVSLHDGVKARLRYWDLKAKYRDLRADSESGTRTAWAVLQAFKGRGVKSQTQEQERLSYTSLRAWTLKEPDQLTPVNLFDSKPPGPARLQEYIYALPDILEAHQKDRGKLIESFARVLATSFRDTSNLKFWYWILWRCFEGECRGISSISPLVNALTRLRTDVVEWEGLKRPGGLLIKRLKVAGIWDSLISC